jgi:signal transduction histidine kinase
VSEAATRPLAARPATAERVGDEAGPGRSVRLAIALVGGSSAALVGRSIDSAVVVAYLVALAGVCLAILAVRRAPSIAWLASIGAGYAASTLWFGRARDLTLQEAGPITWLILVGAASLWAITTVRIAMRYATRPERRIDPVAVPIAATVLGWLVVACLTTVILSATGQRTADPAFTWVDVATLPTSRFLPFLEVVTGLGIAADLLAGRDRAIARLAATPGTVRPSDPWSLGVATLRELVPGQVAAAEAVHATERARIAGDLHATVLPDLRRAIAEAEAGGDAEALATRLRAVDLELERLMADRWPVVLEAFGLLPALEDLAERIEADGGPPVQLDIGRVGERPPPAIERTAGRVAQIAVDNAVRHAAASLLTVTVAAEAGRVLVAVADDGRGFDPSADAVRAGARGLADASRRAADVGGSLRIEAGRGGGTVVTFEWIARRGS